VVRGEGWLGELFGSAAMRAVLDPSATVRCWLDVEVALARAQAQAGLIPAPAAEAITAVCSLQYVDLETLERGTQLVGYPSLPPVRQIAAAAGPRGGAFVPWGATTQDTTDTATILQVWHHSSSTAPSPSTLAR
jgi:3-carboxy-cis,cis-muconate cycloisomerase